MKKFLPVLISLILVTIGGAAIASEQSNELPKCVITTHCVRENWKVRNVEEAFEKAAQIIADTPRTRIIERSDSYLHAEAETRWMHYIDDLEIKVLPEKANLQVRSESRVGIGDNGVNKKRIDDLAYRMSTQKQVSESYLKIISLDELANFKEP